VRTRTRATCTFSRRWRSSKRSTLSW
jgi:hypothetical protein